MGRRALGPDDDPRALSRCASGRGRVPDRAGVGLVIVADVLTALDPVRLMRQMVAEPDPWQADLLRSDARQIVMLCSRQSGKSTVTSVLAAHQALYSPGSLTLIVSPSLRQSGELYGKVRAVLRETPTTQETATTLRLGN